jgi:biopolymer transport protein ExbB/TolQ
MKTLITSKIILTVVLCLISFLSLSAIAGLDESQRQLIQQNIKAKQKLKEAQIAQGAEQKKLMGEHMKMMHDNMGKIQTMKPKSGMTMQEHEEWITEHQKLMDDMMSQMMEEHHMIMDMGGTDKGSDEMDCMSKGSNKEHKH